MKDSWMKTETMRGIVPAVMLSLMLALVGGCGESGSGGGTSGAVTPAGTVTGQVVSSANNAPINGATVKTTVETVTTAADGKFTVQAPVGDRSLLQVTANGFAGGFPIARVTSGQTTNLGVKLIPVGVTAPVSIASGATVSVPNSTARVTIPSNSLVPEGGGNSAGSVNVSLTPINPAVDTSLMPGGFNGISTGGSSERPIESFGALAFDARDSAGARYTLAPGRTATIRIPVGPQAANPPTSMPLWYFDETAGVWREDGTATLVVNGSNRYYEGTVTRVSYWNADLVLDTIMVNGCVKDANNQPVANALVQTEGLDYTGTAFDSTVAAGTFSVAMRKNSRANLRVVEFDPQTFAVVSASNIVKVGPSATDITLTNCLVRQPGPLTITTTALPSGTVGIAYNQTLAASGGVPGYEWGLNTGSNPLPADLELNQVGLIVGVPTTAGTRTITIKVTDSTGATKTKEFAIEIVGVTPPPPPPPPPAPLTITTSTLPGGVVGTAYSTRPEVTGGTGDKLWSISEGSLPEGLKLDAANGTISGTPNAAGTSLFKVRVVDSGTPQQTDDQSLSLTITQAPSPPPICGPGVMNCLTVSNPPAGVSASKGGTFVPSPANASRVGTVLFWAESLNEFINMYVLEQGVAVGISIPLDGVASGRAVYQCGKIQPEVSCPGLTLDREKGTATFTNVVVTDVFGGSDPLPVTLNGTLTFTPF